MTYNASLNYAAADHSIEDTYMYIHVHVTIQGKAVSQEKNLHGWSYNYSSRAHIQVLIDNVNRQL